MASKIIHKHSSVITDGIPKLPTKDQLEYGELAINYSASAETITLRNSSDEIVEFKSKEYYENILNENNYGIASAINYLDDKKQNILVDGETIKTINGESLLGEGDIEIKSLIEVTYKELIELRNQNKLIPGQKYRITDYVTMCVDSYQISDTTVFIESANHPFDIIVEALSDNTLSEDAKAIQREGDTYFTGDNLDAWELKYCLDNDASRFSWINSDCKGVIYYMKDEYNNEVLYDFKNIKFLRTSDFFNTNSFLTHLEGDNYYFTFSNIVNNEIIDSTVYNEDITISIQNKIDKINGTKYGLNNTIFINDITGYTRYNVIGFGNNNNTFGSRCQANTILQHCYNNVVGDMFRNNMIDQYFCNNRVSGQFEYNTLGIQCWKNDFSGHIWFTTFGSQFNYCSFDIPEGSKLEYCDFGSGIGFLNGIPAIRKVTFENNVAWYDTTTYVSNLQTIDGMTLSDALTQEHDDHLYVYKSGDKYGVVSFSDMIKRIDNLETKSIVYSDPKLDFDSTSNNSNTYGYVGTLDSINVKGQSVSIDSISVYTREGNPSPNNTTPVWCRLLRFINNNWEVVYQSTESKIIGEFEQESLFSFKMKSVNENNLVKPTDKIAIVYVSSEDADTISSIELGFKAITVTGGGLQNPLQINSTGNASWCPAFVIGYIPIGYETSEINIGEFANINEVSTKASEINICSNKSITKITFKISNSNGFIEQFITGGPYTINGTEYYYIVQVLNWNGDTSSRQITYKVNNGIRILHAAGNWYKIIDHDITNAAPVLFSRNSEVVDSNSEQGINGVKTFNNKVKIKGDIVITGSDGGNKTIIKNSIDRGELKAFSGDSSYGFIVRTKGVNSTHNIPFLELLATNNEQSYTYKLPALENSNGNATIALNNIATTEKDGLMSASDKQKLDSFESIIEENEYAIATALNDLNEYKQDKLSLGEGIIIENGKISVDKQYIMNLINDYLN